MEPLFVLGALADVLSPVLYTVFTLSALFLIFIILMQEGKGGGLGEAFGGAGAETFGPRVGGVNKFTGTIAAVFVISTLCIHRLERPASFDETSDPSLAALETTETSAGAGTDADVLGGATPDNPFPGMPGTGTNTPPPGGGVSDTELTTGFLNAFESADAPSATGKAAPEGGGESGEGAGGAEGTEGTEGTGAGAAGTGEGSEGTGAANENASTGTTEDPYAALGGVGPEIFESSKPGDSKSKDS